MNQKGQEGARNILFGVIVFAVVALLLIGVFFKVSKGIDREGVETLCKADVLAVHNTAKVQFGLGPSAFKKAVCDRIPLGELSLPRNEEAAKLALSKTLMDEAQSCWDKFGKGELSPYAGEFGSIFSGIHPRCYVCSSFSIPERYSKLEMESSLKEYVELRQDEKTFVQEAFIHDGELETYFGVASMDQSLLDASGYGWYLFGLTGAFIASSYDAERPEFEAVEKWPLVFEGGKVYYVVNIFAVNADVDLFKAGVLNKQAVRSAVAFIDPINQQDICILEN